jgi:hypothetical protein
MCFKFYSKGKIERESLALTAGISVPASCNITYRSVALAFYIQMMDLLSLTRCSVCTFLYLGGTSCLHLLLH